MKLNLIEKAVINNPVRALIQREYEARLLKRLGGRTEGMQVLEIGCGRGVGTEIIFRQFGANRVHAFDLDSAMVEKARHRLSDYSPERLKLYVGNASAMAEEGDQSFDAVFDFAIIHHIPDWQGAVGEIARVLKPGGRFFFEEVTSHALNRWSYRTFFDHPAENRFSVQEFLAELERQGILVADKWVERVKGDFIIGVGRRLEANKSN